MFVPQMVLVNMSVFDVELCVFVRDPIKQVDGHNAYVCKTIKIYILLVMFLLVICLKVVKRRGETVAQKNIVQGFCERTKRL